MKHLVALFFCLLFTGTYVARAQNTGKTIHNRQNWFIYGGRYQLNRHWGIHADVQFRMDEDVKYATTSLLRPGLIRYLNKDMNLVVGYMYGTAYSQGFKQYFREHRLWEQFSTNQQAGKFNMNWRIRVEQRFVQKLKLNQAREVVSDGYRYGNRIRLANRATFDLTRKADAKEVLYLASFAEIFLNVASPEVNRNFFDQDFLMIGVGVLHDKHTRFEVGYLNHFTNPYNRDHNMNHVLQVALFQSLDFSSGE